VRFIAAILIDDLSPQVPPNGEEGIISHLRAVDRDLIPQAFVLFLGGHFRIGVGLVIGGELGIAVLDEVGAVSLADHMLLIVRSIRSINIGHGPAVVVSVPLPADISRLLSRKLQGDGLACNKDPLRLLLCLLAPGCHGLVSSRLGLLGIQGQYADLFIFVFAFYGDGIPIHHFNHFCLYFRATHRILLPVENNHIR